MIIQKKIDLFYWNNPLIALRDKVEVFVFDEYYENSSSKLERSYAMNFSFDGNGVANYPYRVKKLKPPQIKNHIKQKENVIHLNFEWKEKLFNRNSQLFTIGHTINITLDDELPRSPVFENEKLTLWEEDLNNPYFTKKLIEQINKVIYQK